jgi:hypothetical protein
MRIRGLTITGDETVVISGAAIGDDAAAGSGTRATSRATRACGPAFKMPMIGGAERADGWRAERPAGLARRGVLVGGVSPVVGEVPVSVDDLADCGAGGGFVDEVLAGREGGD